MNEFQRTSFAERLKAAAEAKKAQLAAFRPKPSVVDPQPTDRASLKQAELVRVREERTAAKAAKKLAIAVAEEASRFSAASLADAATAERRGERKERKALTKAEAKVKRDARYAARKARK
jgi:hypothetical protein